MTTNRVNDQLEIVLEHNLIASHLDIHEKNIREAILRNTGVKMVVMNLEQVDDIDSLGINFVVGIYKDLKEQGCGFAVTHTSGRIRNLFNLFKLSEYFEVD